MALVLAAGILWQVGSQPDLPLPRQPTGDTQAVSLWQPQVPAIAAASTYLGRHGDAWRTCNPFIPYPDRVAEQELLERPHSTAPIPMNGRQASTDVGSEPPVADPDPPAMPPARSPDPVPRLVGLFQGQDRPQAWLALGERVHHLHAGDRADDWRLQAIHRDQVEIIGPTGPVTLLLQPHATVLAP